MIKKIELPTFENTDTKKGAFYNYLEGKISTPPVHACVGIDPGMGWGVTVIYPSGVVKVMWGKIKGQDEVGKDGITAYDLVKQIVTDNKGMFQSWTGVVEGAAYSMPKGQVHLQEVRWAMYFALRQTGIKPAILPPATIRKIAFGGGRADAMDEWPWMNGNAADSIGCAIAAIYLEEE